MSTTRPTELTESNYYESRDYFSVSMLKQFLGAPGIKGCEARALAEWRGDYQRPATDALLLGSYVDVGLTGTEAEQVRFKEDHPELFSTRGATKGEGPAAVVATGPCVQPGAGRAGYGSWAPR